MYSQSLITSNLGSRFIDLVVLMMSYWLFDALFASGPEQYSLIESILYVATLFVSIRAAKRLVFKHREAGKRCLQTIYGNSMGILFGVIVLALVGQLLPSIQEDFLVVVLSSLTAFFVLGTLSPVVKSSDKDVIHH